MSSDGVGASVFPVLPEVAFRRLPVVPDPRTPHPLRVSVKVVWGEQDPVFPVRLGARVARDPQADLDVVPGVGHHLHMEDPLGLARSIQRFATKFELAPGTGVGTVV
ncbi:MAG: pimeloyl-ACP methyl ester carboxylesterase [Nitriliruptoraceae bacterium]|jgi:pimeloyl-ACP methyl ester carboxylesterase